MTVLGMRRSEMNYAAAEITLLDRDNNITKAYTYPVSKVILRERDNPDKKRTFVVDSNGIWYEEEE